MHAFNSMLQNASEESLINLFEFLVVKQENLKAESNLG